MQKLRCAILATGFLTVTACRAEEAAHPAIIESQKPTMGQHADPRMSGGFGQLNQFWNNIQTNTHTKTLVSGLDKKDFDAFNARFERDCVELELKPCHTVFKLLGVLAAQHEVGFQLLARHILQSHENDKTLLHTLTGCDWPRALTGKDVEVVNVIRKIESYEADKSQFNTLRSKAATEHEKGSFFSDMAYAVSAFLFADKSFFNSMLAALFDKQSAQLVRGSEYFIKTYFIFSNSAFARQIAAGREDLVLSHIRNYLAEYQKHLSNSDSETKVPVDFQKLQLSMLIGYCITFSGEKIEKRLERMKKLMEENIPDLKKLNYDTLSGKISELLCQIGFMASQKPRVPLEAHHE